MVCCHGGNCRVTGSNPQKYGSILIDDMNLSEHNGFQPHFLQSDSGHSAELYQEGNITENHPSQGATYGRGPFSSVSLAWRPTQQGHF
jgi:hypothetical protein